MKKLGILAALVAVLALPAGSLALTIPGTQDQHQDSGPNHQLWGDAYLLAQTFTAGLTGSLDAVTLNLGDIAPQVRPAGGAAPRPAALGDLHVGILATNTGVPAGAPLASEALTGITGGSLLVVVFSSPPHVTAGTRYALVIAAGTSSFVDWQGVCDSNPYSGGQALVLDPETSSDWLTIPAWATAADSSGCINDFEFSTYVTVGATPPPTSTAPAAPSPQGDSTTLLLLAAVLGVGGAFVTVRQVRMVRG